MKSPAEEKEEQESSFKIYLTSDMEPRYLLFKSSISETKDNVALRRLIFKGLEINGRGKFGRQISSENIQIKHMQPYTVRISGSLQKKVKSYAALRGLNKYQGYYDLICEALEAFRRPV